MEREIKIKNIPVGEDLVHLLVLHRAPEGEVAGILTIKLYTFL